jgi:DNA-binding transcriptional ArsR family regulator
MRALAHPVRIALLEALAREGPLTATEASELVDESPANCSFHLRTLAKYGFVEEAEGGTGRNRPWRRVSIGNNFSIVQPDAETSIAARALEEVFLSRTFDRLRRWSGTMTDYPEAWQAAAFTSDILTYLTPEELDGLGKALWEMVRPFRDRAIDRAARPAGAMPVGIAFFGHPVEPTPSGN